MSSFRVCKAKTLSSCSSSERKPRTPEAEVRPGMLEKLYVLIKRVYDVIGGEHGKRS
jgi:hypothetical protein